jgi:hypothetical protein
MKHLLTALILFSFLTLAKAQQVKTDPENNTKEAIPSQDEIYPIDTFARVIWYSECEICDPHSTIGYIVVENQGTAKKPDYRLINFLWPNLTPIDQRRIYIGNTFELKKR